jgi:hypothetical protein
VAATASPATAARKRLFIAADYSASTSAEGTTLKGSTDIEEERYDLQELSRQRATRDEHEGVKCLR